MATRHSGTRKTWQRFSSRLKVEQLEERLTPTGNLVLTNARLVDSNGQPLSSANVGQQVYLEADFTTQGLPSNALYRIGYTVNGFTLDTGLLNSGAGQSGTGSWYTYSAAFVAAAGTNQVTVTVDPDQSVAETSYADNTGNYTFNAALPQVGPISYSVAQMRAAYGVNGIPNFGAAPADGSGQTIAIVGAFNDPNIFSDLDGFDQGMNLNVNSSQSLYQEYGPASSFLTVYNQNGIDITNSIANSGTGAVPPLDPTGNFETEDSLDVEWAHAFAPGAHIDLIEATGGGSYYGLFAGAATARTLPGVTAVSMSWGFYEGNQIDGSAEAGYDASTFVTPSGHRGVTFLAASGDTGSASAYPAFSPNVVAVGGTELTIANNAYFLETGWSFPTPRPLTASSASYAGSWTAHLGGFSGAYATAAGGTAASVTWTTVISQADVGSQAETEVSATWVAGAGNATNATYLIYDGSAATGTLIGVVPVDQTRPPAGTADGNTYFQHLGDYNAASGILTVVLNANFANGTVVADAVGIAPALATGGGPSTYESEPGYQLSRQITGRRTSPDVSADGSNNSGVTIFVNGVWKPGLSGTSLACPCWAALIAIADQGRVANGLPVLDGPNQTLPILYALPASDFHDVTNGYNGYFGGAGYDLMTGLGSPIATTLVTHLAQKGVPVVNAGGPYTVRQGQTVQLNGSATHADYPMSSLTFAWDLDGDDIYGETGAAATNGDEMGPTPTFSAASIVGPAMRTVSLRVTDPLGVVSYDTAAINITQAPPTVANIRINDGSAQRSEVRSLTVTFSGPVTFAGGNPNAAAAFQLKHVQTGNNVGLSAVVSTDALGRTVVTLGFLGSETDPVSALNGGVPSLADGRYQLTIFGSAVAGAGGNSLDGDGDGSPGGNYVSPTDTYQGTGLHLYRLFGDVSGDGVVDAIDLGQFRSTFNASNGQANYLSFLDADNSGAVDASDLGQFRSRFNATVF